MSILMRGALCERAGRRTEIALPFSVSFMADDVAHDDEFGPDGATLFQVHFESETPDVIDACRSANGWSWTHGGAVSRQFARLATAVRAGRDPDVHELRIIDILSTGAGTIRARGRTPVWLDDVRRMIDDTHGWPCVADLAASAGVHRVYLARQFRRFIGCSVSDYIRRRRVQAAASRIGAHRKTLSEIAHASGFHDHAHMCRAFRRECEMSPSEFGRRASEPARESSAS